MSKIVQAVNAMIANRKLISDVVKADDELVFVYKEKYVWSMGRKGSEHWLWYYANSSVSEVISRASSNYWDDASMVRYSDIEIGTKEARASFSELFIILSEKIYGIDAVLDDIIADDFS